MIDKHAFQTACKLLTYRIRNGRCGAVYLGGQQVLAFTIHGDSVIIDSGHFPSVQLCYLPSLKQISICCLLDHFVSSGMRCVDIGAGCGYHSLMFAALAGMEGQIYSFERNPHYFTLLERNVLSNDYSTVVCVNCLIDLDKYFKDAKVRLDFVHISLEEDLPLVFNGMRQIVESNPNLTLLCHIDPLLMLQRDDEYDRLFLELNESGFEAYVLPKLDILSTKEQLLQGRSVKSLLLCR